MNNNDIRKIESIINKKIPNQEFKYISNYTLNGSILHIVFESLSHPGRMITGYARMKGKDIDINSLCFNNPGFNESDDDFNRMKNILDDLIPEDKYCIWLTGYFEDTPGTIYEEEKKVYPRAAFGIWIDPEYIPSDEELVELCKDCGVLALSIEYLPSKMFEQWRTKYDTKEIVEYHNLILEEAANKKTPIQGKDYCFQKPFRVRKPTEPNDKGYLKTECY